MWRCNNELRARAEKLHNRSKRDGKHYIGMPYYVNHFCMSNVNFSVLLTSDRGGDSVSDYCFSCYAFNLIAEFWKQIPLNEPYRVILADVRDKLYNTRERAHQLLSTGDSDIPSESTFTHVYQVCF